MNYDKIKKAKELWWENLNMLDINRLAIRFMRKRKRGIMKND